MIFENQEWPGVVCEDMDDFVQSAVALYSNEKLWGNKSKQADVILSQNFSADLVQPIGEQIKSLVDNLKEHRTRFFLGEIMKTDQMARYKYLSKYIEAKNN